MLPDAPRQGPTVHRAAHCALDHTSAKASSTMSLPLRKSILTDIIPSTGAMSPNPPGPDGHQQFRWSWVVDGRHSPHVPDDGGPTLHGREHRCLSGKSQTDGLGASRPVPFGGTSQRPSASRGCSGKSRSRWCNLSLRRRSTCTHGVDIECRNVRQWPYHGAIGMIWFGTSLTVFYY